MDVIHPFLNYICWYIVWIMVQIMHNIYFDVHECHHKGWLSFILLLYFNVLLGAHAIKEHSQQQSPGKLCTNTRSKPFCWTKPACFNFASSNCNSQGHILSTRGVALKELKRPSFQFTNQPKIINVKKQVIFAVFCCQILKLKIIGFSYHFAEGSQQYRRIFRFIN
jgi:hypothetical protein